MPRAFCASRNDRTLALVGMDNGPWRSRADMGRWVGGVQAVLGTARSGHYVEADASSGLDGEYRLGVGLPEVGDWLFDGDCDSDMMEA